jgi:type IV pilus assembly protein PilB
MLEGATPAKGRGCNHCQNSGYRGRIGIHELMLMTAKVRELAFRGAPTTDIRRQAVRDGMITLYRDGLDKVLRGITTLTEVYRVAKRTEDDFMNVDGNGQPERKRQAARAT